MRACVCQPRRAQPPGVGDHSFVVALTLNCRWGATAAELGGRLDLLVGDALLAAAVVNYLGPFPGELGPGLGGCHAKKLPSQLSLGCGALCPFTVCCRRRLPQPAAAGLVCWLPPAGHPCQQPLQPL